MSDSYVKIASVTGSGSSPTISFTSIPATFTDLIVKFSLRSDTTGQTNFNITLNSTAPTQKNAEGNYTTASSDANTYNFAPAGGSTANVYCNGELYIPNYTNSIAKSMSVNNTMDNTASAYHRSELSAKLYSSVTSAVTTISLTDIYGNWTSASMATLYGIK